MSLLLTALAFAVFTFAGILIARTYWSGEPLADGPVPSEPPIRTLVIAAAILGAICAYRGVPPQALAIIAITCSVMAAIWYADVTTGIVPDALTLIPLGALIIAGFITGHWYVALAAAIPAAPFAFMAWRTKGLGMGWGDVKLAALGGALLGMQAAILAFGLASLVAIVIAKIRRNESQPVAFGPYLASAIIVPLSIYTNF